MWPTQRLHNVWPFTFHFPLQPAASHDRDLIQTTQGLPGNSQRPCLLGI